MSNVPLILEVAYPDRAALKHDAETQLARGGLFVAVDAAALPPLCELTLRLLVDGEALEAPVRLTVASEQAACVEIAPAVLEALLADVAARTDGEEARAGDKEARIVDPSEAAPPKEDTRGQLPLDRRIAVMSVSEKVQLALHGNRDARMLLLRERAGIVQASLVRNPKTTADEVQMLARSAHLAPETADVLAQHQTYGMSPQIALALVRNPRTPIPVAAALVSKLTPNDLRTVAKGLGVRMQVAAAARKRLNDPTR